jgi:hypothetical protein
MHYQQPINVLWQDLTPILSFDGVASGGQRVAMSALGGER